MKKRFLVTAAFAAIMAFGSFAAVAGQSSGTSADPSAKQPRDTFTLSDSPARPKDAAEASFVWKNANSAGDCTINGGAKLVLRADGTASWSAKVKSRGDDDAYCVRMHFHDRNTLLLFEWPRFCSQTLTSDFQTWTNNNLAFPQFQFPFITQILRWDSC